MNPSAPLALALALALGGSASAQDRPRPPWSALTSPTAAMKVAFDEVCLTAVAEGRSIETLALDHYLRAVRPGSTGSPSATAAWRLGSWSNVYVMALPGGGCSASIEAGDPEGLNTAAITAMMAHGSFSPAAPETVNNAERIAWCTGEADRPLIVVLLKKTGGRRDAFLANVFRAQGARPPFCPAV